MRVLLVSLLAASLAFSQNRKDREEWFRDLGFGMFIHWGFDVALGSVISHSLPGASPDYVKRYYDTLPRYFNPTRFEPAKWAAVAKLAGMKYVVFTTKHHSGFAMFDTKTTKMNVMNTPFGRDVTKAIVDAFRAEGIAVGFYFSPDDFYWFHTNGYTIARPPAPKTTTKELPAMLEYGKSQLKELLDNYGKIDMLFIDGPADGLREYGWQLSPDLVVTRGAMETPEQGIPEVTMDVPWEACLTMGTAWQHKPTNEEYRSGTQWIKMLIEVRAKGGNLLLNIGPKPDGELAPEEEGRLREIALWNFVNGESIDGVRPWVVSREGDIWFTKKRNEPTVYAFWTGTPIGLGERREFILKSVKATAATQVTVLGQSGELLEYRPKVDAATRWKQESDGLHVSMMRAQRLYDNRRWPNPVVMKITNAQPAFQSPSVLTTKSRYDDAQRCHILEGELTSLGSSPSIEVSFQYRKRRGLADLYEPIDPWKNTPFEKRTATGKFTHCLMTVAKDGDYEYRAIVRHPLGVLLGAESPFRPSEVVKIN